MTVYAFGACRLDPGARDLTVDGTRVHLGPQVFDVLAYLVSRFAAFRSGRCGDR